MMTKLLSFLALAIIPLATASPVAFASSNSAARNGHVVAPQIPSRLSRRGVPTPPGFKKVLFLEDFSTYTPGSQPSADKWTIDTGHGYPGGPTNWGTNEVESYDASPKHLIITHQGTMLITPTRNTNDPNSWSSARIESTPAHDFNCEPGQKIFISATIRLRSESKPGSSQLGIWPAFWMMGSDFRGKPSMWPSVGEIDILESVNGLSQIWHTVHCGVEPGGPCNEKSGLGNKGNVTLTRDGWHTVGVRIDRTNPGGDWTGETITYVLDGVETFTLNGYAVNDQNAWIALTRNRKFILFNVAVGGDMPNAISGSTTPTPDTKGGAEASMEVKWVGVWST